MSDVATANIPSRDFTRTETFYGALGFATGFRDDGWMILKSGTLILEFFAHAKLDPTTSWHSSCLRLDDLDGFYALCKAAGIIEVSRGEPRLHPPELQGDMWIAALIDPDGTLLRLIQN
jgi:catechol 2,3-dioxygenase-like lactoylglutathione lyase family enzyme